MKCSRCKFENSTDSRFCRRCGIQLFSPEEEPSFTRTALLKTPPRELPAGSIFASRFRVVEELGRGGMGRVYKAYDTEIKEHVALKVLDPEIVSEEGIIERFRNELKFARRISHRNVCRSYDLARSGDTVYITMEFVPGEDLKSLLKRTGQFAVKRAVEISLQVCEGLAEAHRLGVVHRDLKPQNIMIDREGNARILDFGIARSVSAKGKGITDTGAIIGTPDYISPEQLEGLDVDHRTDIYALGVILFEMVTGEPLFDGETPLSVAMKHKTEEPRNPKELIPQLPLELSRLILRCLEKDREKRFPSSEEVLAELKDISAGLPSTRSLTAKTGPTRIRGQRPPPFIRRAAILALSAAALAAGVLFLPRLWQKMPEGPLTAGAAVQWKNSIAVLPFEDMSPERNQEHFCNGITEDLITKLASVGQLKVISRTSVMSYKGAQRDIKDIGKELGVETILEGSLQKEGENVRVNVQLINVRDGSHLWAESFDRKLEGIFTIQDEISKAIVAALKIELVAGQDYMLVKRYTQDPDAYSLYLEGRFQWNKRTEAGLRRSIELYQEALARDPDFALAYAGIADAYSFLGRLSYASPKDVYPRAREAAEKSLALDGALAEGYVALAFVKYNYDWDWMGAEIDFNWALGLNPNYATAYQYYGSLLENMGRFDEARAKFGKAAELDPNSVPIQASQATLSYLSRQYDRAIQQWKAIIKADPGLDWTHYYLGLAYLQKKSMRRARKEFEKAERIQGGSRIGSVGLACAQALAGDEKKARISLEELIKGSAGLYISAYNLALIYTALGEKGSALESLDRAYAQRDTEIVMLKTEPLFDSLRDDPRFEALLERMDLN